MSSRKGNNGIIDGQQNVEEFLMRVATQTFYLPRSSQPLQSCELMWAEPRCLLCGIFWCDFSKISPSLEARIPQIFGHTPTGINGVKTAHGLKLIDIDSGMCRVYDGTRVYLEITPQGYLLQHSKVDSKWETVPLGI